MKRSGKKGFTLVEIMVVVAVVALLAAAAVPQMIRAMHNANESAAIASLRTISAACEIFRATEPPPPAYPANLAALGATIPPLIDSALAGATAPGTARQGYFYTYGSVNANQYACTATPSQSGTTGTRVFFVDESTLVRLNDAAGAVVE